MAATPVLVPTTLFVCDFTPQKICCALPLAQTYSIEQVEAVVNEDLHLPLGHFVRLPRYWTQNGYWMQNVGIFVHSMSVGCSKVKPSSPHKNFLFPDKNNVVPMRDLFRLTPDVKVGYSYLTGYDVPYELSPDGKLKIEVDFTLTDEVMPEEVPQQPPTELERTAHMLYTLSKTYADVFTVHYPTPISIGPLCPFSGGGDIFIERKAPFTRPDTVSRMVIDTGADTGAEEEGEEGEGAGGGLAENKTFSDVRSEMVLQANMMVQCASSLYRVLTWQQTRKRKREQTAHDIPDIQLVTCYGMRCGGKFPLKILKLTMDFTNKSICFEEHFNLRVESMFYPPCVDRALKYIIDHI